MYYIFPPVSSKTRNKGNQTNKVHLFFPFLCLHLHQFLRGGGGGGTRAKFGLGVYRPDLETLTLFMIKSL